MRCCNRRTAIVAILSTLFTRTATAQSPATPGWLTIPLDQWIGVSVTHQGETVHLRAVDIIAALKEI